MIFISDIKSIKYKHMLNPFFVTQKVIINIQMDLLEFGSSDENMDV